MQMQSSMLGVVFTENIEAKLGELTRYRSLAALPVGGRYRIIDFVLSNMVNSGITNVGVTTLSNYQSLMDHIGTGKAWDLNRKENGLFLLPPFVSRESPVEVQGGIDILYGIMGYLRRSKQEYVVINDCNTVCNMTFTKPLEFHHSKKADITLIYHNQSNIEPDELRRNIIIETNEDAKVTDIHVNPFNQRSDKRYMHMFIIKKSLLIELVENCVAHGERHISKDIFLKNLNKLNIYGYEYDGYVKTIDTVQSYFSFNLDLLDAEKRNMLCGGENSVYTKVKDKVPTKYGNHADVSNSVIADGCVIDGTVTNSILFRGVHVGKGANINNCVIMQDSEIMENGLLENAILDKEVIVKPGKKLIGQETYPVLVGKRAVV